MASVYLPKFVSIDDNYCAKPLIEWNRHRLRYRGYQHR
jgi:hypothetical protein